MLYSPRGRKKPEATAGRCGQVSGSEAAWVGGLCSRCSGYREWVVSPNQGGGFAGPSTHPSPPWLFPGRPSNLWVARRPPPPAPEPIAGRPRLPAMWFAFPAGRGQPPPTDALPSACSGNKAGLSGAPQLMGGGRRGVLGYLAVQPHTCPSSKRSCPRPPISEALMNVLCQKSPIEAREVQ